MRKKVASIVGTVLLAGGALATASPASAATPPPPGGGSWDHTWTTTDAAHGGTVHIDEHGDWVVVCDTAADKHAPWVDVRAKSSNGQFDERYKLTATGGKGDCTGAHASDGRLYNLPEHDEISVAVWLGPNVGHYGSQHVYVNDH